jgi:radical SAM protein with 4Fe4S-binding SPASM domain
MSGEEIVERILRPCRELGAFQVNFSGGEFLLRDDALDLVRAAVEMGYDPKIATNGKRVNAALLKELRRIAGRKCVLAFGINSIRDAGVHRDTRKTRLPDVLSAMELCKRYQIPRHAVVTVGRFNLDELDAIFGWLEEKRIPFNRVPFVPRNSGRDFFERFGFSREEMQNAIHPALNRRYNGYVSFVPFFLSPEIHAEVSGGRARNVTVPHNPSIGCWVGTWLAFSPEGDVAPCALLLDTPLVAGNVRERTIFDILDNSETFRRILDRNRLKGKCGRCRYRFTCGGCRALAYYRTGDCMEADPTCFFEPEDETTRAPQEEQTNRLFRKYARMAFFAGMYRPPARD